MVVGMSWIGLFKFVGLNCGWLKWLGFMFLIFSDQIKYIDNHWNFPFLHHKRMQAKNLNNTPKLSKINTEGHLSKSMFNY